MLTTLVWLCALMIGAAQDATYFNQVIGSTGRFAVQNGRSSASTVGEVVIPTVTSGNQVLTQGFHQPEQTRIVSVGNPDLTDWDIRVFPNPVSDLLTIQFSTAKGSSLRATVVDVVGKVVLTDQPVSAGSLLDCRAWQPGVYFVVLTDPITRASAMTRVIRM